MKKIKILTIITAISVLSGCNVVNNTLDKVIESKAMQKLNEYNNRERSSSSSCSAMQSNGTVTHQDNCFR